MIGFTFLTMFLLIFIGVPVAFSILSSGVLFLTVTQMKPLILVAQRIVTGLDSFPLLAVPLFMLVGTLMEQGGISKRMVRWAENLVGWMPGGIGAVAIVSCAIFAALTGSGPATVAAIGAIMIPSMIEKGYTLKSSAGLIAAAGALGPIIPPSIPMIIYGVTMNLSIPDMFIAGIIPGLLLTVVLILVNTVIALKNPEIMSHKISYKFSIIKFFKDTWHAIGAILLPIIILGGIYGGYFTPTEAAAIGVVYSLILSILIYRTVKLKDLPKILITSLKTAAMVNFIIAAANLLSWIMSVTNFSTIVSTFILNFVQSKVAYLLILNFILLFVGALMDNVAATIILAPIIIPIGLQLGLEPLHLGMVFTINLIIGYVTPPFGYNLFTATSITKLKFDEVVKGILPFLSVEIAVVFLISFVPDIINFLPNLMK